MERVNNFFRRFYSFLVRLKDHICITTMKEGQADHEDQDQNQEDAKNRAGNAISSY